MSSTGPSSQFAPKEQQTGTTHDPALRPGESGVGQVHLPADIVLPPLPEAWKAVSRGLCLVRLGILIALAEVITGLVVVPCLFVWALAAGPSSGNPFAGLRALAGDFAQGSLLALLPVLVGRALCGGIPRNLYAQKLAVAGLILPLLSWHVSLTVSMLLLDASGVRPAGGVVLGGTFILGVEAAAEVPFALFLREVGKLLSEPGFVSRTNRFCARAAIFLGGLVLVSFVGFPQLDRFGQKVGILSPTDAATELGLAVVGWLLVGGVAALVLWRYAELIAVARQRVDGVLRKPTTCCENQPCITSTPTST